MKAITVHRPTPSFEADTDIEEPPTTVELVRRRHWKTLWNRARYELRRFLRLPHRRFAAGAISVSLAIATTAFLADHFGPRMATTSRNSTPPRQDDGSFARTSVAPPRPLADNSVPSTAMSPAPSAVASGRRGRRYAPLTDGTYFINRWFATVRRIPKTIVPIGHVGVVVSDYGQQGRDLSGTAFRDGERVEEGERGVWEKALGPASTRSTPTPAAACWLGHESTAKACCKAAASAPTPAHRHRATWRKQPSRAGTAT